MADLPQGLSPIQEQPAPTEQTTEASQLPAGLTPVQEAPPKPEYNPFSIGPDLYSAVSEDISKRVESGKQTMLSYLGGQISKPEAAVQMMGAGAGGILDVLGETLTAAGKSAYYILPEDYTGPAIDTMKNTFNYLANTSLGQDVADVLSKGMDKWDEFKKDNPQTAKDIESAVNIGMIAAPVKTKAKADPIKPLEGTAKFLEKAAQAQKTKVKRKFIEELAMPKQTAKVKTEQVARTVEEGLLGKKKVMPTPREAEMMDELMKIPSVSADKTLQGNYNSIVKANEDLATKLAADVAKSKTPILVDTSKRRIDTAVNDLIQSNPVIVGNAETTAKRVANKAKEIIDTKPPTASGMLEARKELDTWVRSQKGDAIFDPSSENALSISVRRIRQTMNDIVDQNVASTKVKDELRRQSLLYDAIDNITPKAAEEASTAIGRLWQNAAKVVPFKAQLNRELAVLLGMSSFGAASYFAPYLVGGLALTGAGVAAVKGVTSPQVKQAVAKIIRMSDQAIRTTKNPKMLKQLRADRAAAVEFLKYVKTQEEEKNKEINQ